MAVFKCKMCGAPLSIGKRESVAVCDYCGAEQTVPRLNSEKREKLYDMANHFRRNNDYDKAMSYYEKILEETEDDAEAYWSLVLCRYGIEYVEDPSTHRRIPTINRAQYTSVFADENYKSAIKCADGNQRRIYEAEAQEIDTIQKEILEISRKEKPFDIFICYKETDKDGRRTTDSVLATDLYHQLIQEGFKVFFSRITLEDKLGTAYEPYIFAALNSAKVMVVLGTKSEYFNAVWVKNEWSRYLTLIKNGAKKILIPAYRDMDPYDLPEEFSHLQAQDMSKLGFMQDLIRGIKKICNVNKEVGKSESYDLKEKLLKNAGTYMKLGDMDSARQTYEKVTKENPEEYRGWWGLIICETDNLAKLDPSEEKINTWFKYIRKLVPENQNKEYKILEQKYRNYLYWLSEKQVDKEIEKQKDAIKSIIQDIENKIQATQETINSLLGKQKQEYDTTQLLIDSEEQNLMSLERAYRKNIKRNVNSVLLILGGLVCFFAGICLAIAQVEFGAIMTLIGCVAIFIPILAYGMDEKKPLSEQQGAIEKAKEDLKNAKGKQKDDFNEMKEKISAEVRRMETYKEELENEKQCFEKTSETLAANRQYVIKEVYTGKCTASSLS